MTELKPAVKTRIDKVFAQQKDYALELRKSDYRQRLAVLKRFEKAFRAAHDKIHESAADDRRPGRASRSRAGWVARGAVSATPVRLQCVERRVANGARPVCTCDEVHFDEVEFGRSMRLAECPRCEHRWHPR